MKRASGWLSIEIDWPVEKLCGEPDSTIDRSSSSSREPDESSSSAPKIAFTIAWGAVWPVMDLRALSNSLLERVPLRSESNFEKSDSAERPLSLRISCRFLIAIASIFDFT